MTGAEEWRPVVGYEGWYEVSSIGRVKRVKAARGATVGTILRIQVYPNGYPYAQLCRDSRYKKVCLHLLVAEAFIGPRPPGLEVNHIDADKSNARATNLEFVTHSENIKHSYRLGRSNLSRLCKITPEMVPEIRRLAKIKTHAEVAKQFGLSRQQVGGIASRKRWALVP